MIDFDVVVLDLENSDIAAVSFEGTQKKSILRGVLAPLNMIILLVQDPSKKKLFGG
jgi:hypothetical protein